MDNVRITAHRAVFNEPLFDAAGWIEGNNDLLAAGRAGVRAFIEGPATFFLTLFHFLGILTKKSGHYPSVIDASKLCMIF